MAAMIQQRFIFTTPSPVIAPTWLEQYVDETRHPASIIFTRGHRWRCHAIRAISVAPRSPATSAIYADRSVHALLYVTMNQVR